MGALEIFFSELGGLSLVRLQDGALAFSRQPLSLSLWTLSRLKGSTSKEVRAVLLISVLPGFGGKPALDEKCFPGAVSFECPTGRRFAGLTHLHKPS